MSEVVTVSVVSHRQNHLVNQLLQDIHRECSIPLRLVLTQNTADTEPLVSPGTLPTEVIVNRQPKGFGANHNVAFGRSRSNFFCVLNPDVRFANDPFPPLLEMFADARLSVAAPKITDGSGQIEVTARRFPTPWSILRKAFGQEKQDYGIGSDPVPVDWVAGMFMLFRREAFAFVRGFDERYFLYYEDADICRRLRKAGLDVRINPRSSAIHLARRTSHHDWRYLRWHLSSMMRFFAGR